MTKDEILEKSRNEYKNQDVYDLEVQNKASKVSSEFCCVLACIVFIVTLIVKGELRDELFMLITGMETVLFVIKYIKMQKRHELIVAICYGIGFICTTYIWIKQLCGF